ncbi:complement factor I-like [Salminus brasiliensis]|uniref:complement factor I-like n=1 Tax=Salminus brasiliensis TaxID=930266 RepID=UPI003B83A22B
MRITLGLLLILLLQLSGCAESSKKKNRPKEISPSQPGKNSPPPKTSATKPTTSSPAPGPAPGPAPQQHKNPPPKWLSQECLRENYTHLSCSKVFCPPWRRCISGQCVCKLPYQCPRIGETVCGLDRKSYLNYCQAQAAACRANKPVFSHYGLNCNECFEVSLMQSGGHEVVQVKTTKGRALVCGTKTWNIAAANVVCRHQKNDARGAVATEKVKSKDLDEDVKLPQCISVRCTGSELTLAECTIYEPQAVEDSTEVAAVSCYTKRQEVCSEFTCVNQKCVLWKYTCDGVDHCGDNSDEMCCNSCQMGFYCKPGVCIPSHAVQDGIRDCLGGEDEIPGARPNKASNIYSFPLTFIH